MTEQQMYQLRADLEECIQATIYGPNNRGMCQAPKSLGSKATVDFFTREIVITSPSHEETRYPVDEFAEAYIDIPRERGDLASADTVIGWVRKPDGSYTRDA